MWGAYYPTPQDAMFQVWLAPEMPLNPRHRHSSSLDSSPLPSPGLSAGHPLPLPPLSPVRDLTGASQSTPIPLHVPKHDFAPTLEPIKSKWQKGKLIGRGTFGSVYVASNRYYLAKLISKYLIIGLVANKNYEVRSNSDFSSTFQFLNDKSRCFKNFLIVTC